MRKTDDKEFCRRAVPEAPWGGIVGQGCRKAMYGDVTDRWLDGDAPTEAEEKYKAELKAPKELDGATSDGGPDTDGDGADGRVGPERGVTAPDRSRRPHQAPPSTLAPDPPQSVDNPVP